MLVRVCLRDVQYHNSDKVIYSSKRKNFRCGLVKSLIFVIVSFKNLVSNWFLKDLSILQQDVFKRCSLLSRSIEISCLCYDC